MMRSAVTKKLPATNVKTAQTVKRDAGSQTAEKLSFSLGITS